jgi:hypothetical protein
MFLLIYVFRAAEMALHKLCQGHNGALASTLAWEAGSWHQKLHLARKIADDYRQGGNVENRHGGGYDPLRSALEIAAKARSPRAGDDDCAGNSDTHLEELQALACA